MTNPLKRGRPISDVKDKIANYVQVGMKPDERAALDKMSRKKDVSSSSFVRSLIVKMAIKQGLMEKEPIIKKGK